VFRQTERKRDADSGEEGAAERLRDVEEQEAEDEEGEAGRESDANPLERWAGAGDRDAEQDRPHQEEDQPDSDSREQRRAVDVIVELTHAGVAVEKRIADCGCANAATPKTAVTNTLPTMKQAAPRTAAVAARPRTRKASVATMPRRPSAAPAMLATRWLTRNRSVVMYSE
jgi:hypothetical protein